MLPSGQSIQIYIYGYSQFWVIGNVTCVTTLLDMFMSAQVDKSC